MRTIFDELGSLQKTTPERLLVVVWKTKRSAPVNCWLQLQVAICVEGLVGQDQLLLNFDVDL